MALAQNSIKWKADFGEALLGLTISKAEPLISANPYFS